MRDRGHMTETKLNVVLPLLEDKKNWGFITLNPRKSTTSAKVL